MEEGPDSDHTYLVAADSTGKVVRISVTDSKEQFRPKQFGSPTSMIYTDVNNDGVNEYVFLSADELTVFNQQKELSFNYKFRDKVLPQPIILKQKDGAVKLGAVSSSANQVYLLNSNGSLVNAFPVKGNTLFIIGDLTTDDISYLITGTLENTLAAYTLE